MHTFQNRLSSLTSNTLNGFFAIAIFVALSSFWLNKTSLTHYLSTSEPIVKSIKEYYISSYNNDLSEFQISLDVDTSSFFHWNVKQVMLFIAAYYSTPDQPRNEIILWDRIITSENPKKSVQFKNKPLKYRFLHDGDGLLSNKNITLKLLIETVPHIGLINFLWPDQHITLKFPDSYSK